MKQLLIFLLFFCSCKPQVEVIDDEPAKPGQGWDTIIAYHMRGDTILQIDTLLVEKGYADEFFEK